MRGFSLVELTVVLVLVAILAVVALPRFVGTEAFVSLGFYDSTQAAVRYAQKLAIAQRCTVDVVVSSGSMSIAYGGGACGTAAVKNPLTNTDFVVTAPSGVSIADAIVSFDGLGQSSAATTFTITDSDGSRSFFVEPVTGYVHP